MFLGRGKVFHIVTSILARKLFQKNFLRQGLRSIVWIGEAERVSNEGDSTSRGVKGMLPTKPFKFRASKMTRNAYISINPEKVKLLAPFCWLSAQKN